ncbi:helix-turn-helix domain-containing protein [Salibacterium aidingense]|uniref:helix-turn-helix domain-containing protein n=1 Tax=Salibacterium aidingense TaxID=384933 RepID=UPI00146F9CAB|nr:helix-turn-helix transcriptional regulator [Salibacterium aidingense]
MKQYQSLASETSHPVSRSIAIYTQYLTHKEIEVLSNILDGNSYRDIASLMGIKLATVNNHLTHVHRKLNLTTTIEMFRRGFEVTFRSFKT